MAANPFKKTDNTEEPVQEKASTEKSRSQNKKAAASILGEKVLRTPRVTEKAVRLTDEQNQYVFQVHPDATKGMVKDAVEGIYGVNVEGVNMITLPRKKVRFRRYEGTKVMVKKAVVQIKKGEKIEILPV